MEDRINLFIDSILNIGHMIYAKIISLYMIISENIKTSDLAIVISVFSLLLAYYSLRCTRKQSKEQSEFLKDYNLFQEKQASFHANYNRIQKRHDEIQDAASEYYKHQSDELYKLQSETNLAIEYKISDKTQHTGIFTVHNRGMSKAKNITFTYKLNDLAGFNYKGVTNNGEIVKDKEAKIYVLDPNESSSIVVAFREAPPPVEVDYAWDNVSGKREHRSRTLSPLCF